MKVTDKLITAIGAIILGVLFIALKGGVIGVAMTVLGVALIVWGVSDLVKGGTVEAVIKIALGVISIVFGWALASVALYILAALLVVYGVMSLYPLIKDKCKDSLSYIAPVVVLVVGLCLFFNQGGTVNWVFIVSGIFLVIYGVLNLVESLKNE